MVRNKRVIGGILVLIALLLLAFEHIDIIGHINAWRHVPAVAPTEHRHPVSDEASSSAQKPPATPMKDKNPYLADIARWHAANIHAVAWLHIPNVLSTPVVQGGDNEYYLNHDATAAANKNGAAFIDYEVPESKADNVVIYGHNMANSQVFSDLDAFRNESHAKAHRRFDYATERGVWQAEVLCVCNMNLKDARQFFSFNSWLTWQDGRNAVAYLEGLKPSMLFRLDTPIAPKDRVLTLSTCDNAQADARILIVARLLPSS